MGAEDSHPLSGGNPDPAWIPGWDKLSSDEESMTKRLTSQFTSMNSRVSQYKSIQSFLTQQVEMWTKSGS